MAAVSLAIRLASGDRCRGQRRNVRKLVTSSTQCCAAQLSQLAQLPPSSHLSTPGTPAPLADPASPPSTNPGLAVSPAPGVCPRCKSR